MAFTLKAFLPRGGKKKRVRRVRALRWLIPFACTLANAVLGFSAIINAFEGRFMIALACIIGAAIMDMLDGRLARWLGTTSGLGAELDSLSDVVSFCLAPTIVLYMLIDRHDLILLTVLGCYLCAGLLRLARFMVIHGNTTDAFCGLPTPAAALWLAAYMQYALQAQTIYGWVTHIWVISVCVMVLAMLMISTITYPSLKRFSVYNPRHRLYGLVLLLACLLSWFIGYPTILIIFTAYIVAGVVTAATAWVKRLGEWLF
jgi:CDP-diacylglycerol--serine O-phosphatidyltransferase